MISYKKHVDWDNRPEHSQIPVCKVEGDSALARVAYIEPTYRYHTKEDAQEEKMIVLALVRNPGAAPTGLSGLRLRVNIRFMRCSLFPGGYVELWRVTLRERDFVVDARVGAVGPVDRLRR